MPIPAFPDFRQISLEDKPAFDEALAANPPELSTYTFTNLFAWRVPYRSSVSTLNGMILVRVEAHGSPVYFEPIGSGDTRRTLEQVFESGGGEVVCERLHKRTIELFAGDSRYIIEEDRDNSDYLYLTSDLIELTGRKYDAKRNFINRFKQEHSYKYIELDQGNVMLFRDFASYWCEEKLCHTVEGLAHEQCAVYEMLCNFDNLGISGGAIWVDGKITAFSLGEALNPETFVIHVEKADAAIDGMYQMINNEFCIHAAHPYKHINREQDLGVPGLRKAKESYHPVRLVESYKMRPIG